MDRKSKERQGYFHSRIMSENNLTPPIEVYHAWGRWRVVRLHHQDEKNNREQYVLQRYSDSKKVGKLWHMVAFFWSFEDLEEFLDEMDKASSKIEEVDGENILYRSPSDNLRKSRGKS